MPENTFYKWFLFQINQLYVGGLPDPHSISLGPAAGQQALQPTTLCRGSSPVRLSLGPVTSSRPPSAMEARFFNDEVSVLNVGWRRLYLLGAALWWCNTDFCTSCYIGQCLRQMSKTFIYYWDTQTYTCISSNYIVGRPDSNLKHNKINTSYWK